jgi:F0F1-type ATP synthase assembly protein I
LIGAFFGNLIETPQAAIPLYLVLGLLIGPMFLQTDPVYHAEEPAPAHVAELV